MNRFRSIISRIVALHVVAIAVTSLLMPFALYRLLDQAANELHRDALRAHAISIANFLKTQPDGALALDIPDEVQALYTGAYGLYTYSVLDASGRVVFSSQPDGGALFVEEDKSVRDWFVRRRGTGTVLFGINVLRSVEDQPYWIQVGQDLAHRDVIVDDVVATFLPRVAWITFPILVLLLLIDIVIFRRALAPVQAASTTAAGIGPSRTDLRLSEQGMPSEIVPLVRAVNQALDRLETGFRAQRDFTADMAHELRTPLAVVRARVDSLDGGPVRDALRADLVNVTRTVNQALDIAELESFIVDDKARADVHAICVDVVTSLAPLSVDLGKTMSLTGVEGPVWVRGHAEALFRAVRNLVDNAIRHTPPAAAIEIEVDGQGTIRVLDDGPGVPVADRQSIFRRFWRRDGSRGDGHGLGLAIVARVAAAHGASVAVEDRPGGGAAFILRLQLA